MMLRPHFRYLWYIIRHKCFVFRAGLITGAPLWRLLIHDWSKFTPTEWGPYVERFFSGRAGTTGKSSDSEAFHRAWTHHWHSNPHHWEHWLRMGDGCSACSVPHLEPMDIPEHFIREMVADWCGAGRGIAGRWAAWEWYEREKDKMMLSTRTRLRVLYYLDIVKARLA